MARWYAPPPPPVSAARHGAAWGVVPCHVVPCNFAGQCGVAWSCVVWCGMAWHGLVLCCVVLSGVVWCGLVWSVAVRPLPLLPTRHRALGRISFAALLLWQGIRVHEHTGASLHSWPLCMSAVGPH